MKRLGLLTAIAAMTLAAESFASCAMSSFEWQLLYAKLVFAGTLSSTQRIKTATGIETRYRFDHVAYVKGDGPRDSLIIVEDIGCWAGTCIESSTDVSLVAGRRYVLLAWGTDGRFYPLPCAASPFVVRRESNDEQNLMETVAYLDRRHIVIATPRDDDHSQSPTSIEEQIRLADAELAERLKGDDPAVAQRAWNRVAFLSLPTRLDRGDRVPEAEFLRVVKEILTEIELEPEHYKQ